MKTCTTCKQAKPATTEFFNRASRLSDGLNCYCRECSTARQRRRNHEKMMARPEYVEALDRKQRGVRQCTKCKEEKPATNEFFHSRKQNPDGCREVCRICRAADHAEHRDARLPKRRKHYAKNQDRLNAISKDYYQKNIEAQRASGRARHHKNREVRLVQYREYREKNRDEINARRRPKSVAAFHARYRVDLRFTLKHRVGSLLRVSLKNGRKSRRMAEILDYDTETLRAHLEAQFADGMTWGHFMRGEMHIDHKKPVSSFDITSDACPEFKQCWALSNLRPMWARDNLSKGAKTVEEYEQTCLEH